MAKQPETFLQGSGVVRVGGAILNDAQIKALPTTPFEVVPAPGPGYFSLPLSANLHLEWVADYTNIDGSAFLFIDDAPGDQFITNLSEAVSSASLSGLLANGENSNAILPPLPLIDTGALFGLSGFPDTDLLNQALRIHVNNGASGNFTGGNVNNVLRVTVLYSIIRIP